VGENRFFAVFWRVSEWLAATLEISPPSPLRITFSPLKTCSFAILATAENILFSGSDCTR
jgi:hypothetical protein